MKYVRFLLIGLIIPGIHSSAQTISMPADSVTTLLCRHWEMSYTLMDGQRILNSPQSARVDYDFRPDHTLEISNNQNDTRLKGTWNYDLTNKLIILMINGKHDIIVSLNENEYVQKVETAKGTPEILIVYKPLSKPSHK